MFFYVCLFSCFSSLPFIKLFNFSYFVPFAESTRDDSAFRDVLRFNVSHLSVFIRGTEFDNFTQRTKRKGDSLITTRNKNTACLHGGNLHSICLLSFVTAHRNSSS